MNEAEIEVKAKGLLHLLEGRGGDRCDVCASTTLRSWQNHIGKGVTKMKLYPINIMNRDLDVCGWCWSGFRRAFGRSFFSEMDYDAFFQGNFVGRHVCHEHYMPPDVISEWLIKRIAKREKNLLK